MCVSRGAAEGGKKWCERGGREMFYEWGNSEEIDSNTLRKKEVRERWYVKEG